MKWDPNTIVGVDERGLHIYFGELTDGVQALLEASQTEGQANVVKIWHLTANDEDLPKEDNPWIPWYNKCFAMIVVAETEDDARRIAQANGCDENDEALSSEKSANKIEPWLESRYSACVELSASVAGLVIRDVRNA